MTSKKIATGPAADDPSWGLFYRETKKNLDARKSIKVKLPIRQHIKLHAMKLFSENNISETVERALDAYFQQMKAEDDLARAQGEGSDSVGVPTVEGALPTNANAGTALHADDDEE